MNPQMDLSFRVSRAVREKRESKRESIRKFFLEKLGAPIGSSLCHQMFGPSFRTRVSEIRRDVSGPLVIDNVTVPGVDGIERSIYVSRIRGFKETIQ